MMHSRLCLLSSLSFSILSLSYSHVAEAEPSFSPFSAALETLQKQIGYDFQSVDLLRRAMTHPSYSLSNYRTLSNLGLNAIQASASLQLLQKDIDITAEAMDGRIKEITSVDVCAAVGSRLGLEKVVRVSAKTNSSAPAVVCGAFRAMFGGVAVDSGGIDAAWEVFRRVHGGGVAVVGLGFS